MRLESIKVDNYRSIKSETIPLSNFVCLIGKNNSGKSSFLQCISLVTSGSKLKESDFYDPNEPIRIELTLSDISASDLLRVTTDLHRNRFADLLEDARLRLVRTYDPATKKSSLSSVKQMPANPNLRGEAVSSAISGKSGEELRAIAVSLLPQLDEVLPTRPTQKNVRDQIDEIIRILPNSELIDSDEPLPTGLDRSILPLLPEVIYIPAVQDVTDEIKTSETSSFGKLIRILFDQIEDQIGDLSEQFATLQGKLSRVEQDGRVVDNRLPQVIKIENTIEKYVQANFPRTKLKISIPAPELRTVLNAAELLADDGYEGPIVSKGDGLKRAVTFAVLQAYAELKSPAPQDEDLLGEVASEISASSKPYVLLFEEPELYLHPEAQDQLLRALEVFAQAETVVISTHNPRFLNANNSKIYIKLYKTEPIGSSAPYVAKHVIDLSEISSREQMQLVTYENNNAALFATKVVLVEGDSDFIVYPHLHRTLTADSEPNSEAIVFVRANGKGSLQRYRRFFDNFGIKVFCIADLDILLNDFEKLDPTPRSIELRNGLFALLDRNISENPPELNAGALRGVVGRDDTRGRWQTARQAHINWAQSEGEEDWLELQTAMDRLFEKTEAPLRYKVLQESSSADVSAIRDELIVELSLGGAYVLKKGCLEDYYPQDLSRSDKVESAIEFCERLPSKELLTEESNVLSELARIVTEISATS